jgi:hypothetical protein
MDSPIVNKVAQSGILTLDLEGIIPEMEQVSIDIKDQLFQGLILKEKDFREWISTHNWDSYNGKRIALFCSGDAIIPTWAYMLVAKAVSEHHTELYYCQPQDLDALVAQRYVSQLQVSEYEDKRVVIKGCGDRLISNHAYVALSEKLIPVVKSLMFGEPCSTVPVYKKK